MLHAYLTNATNQPFKVWHPSRLKTGRTALAISEFRLNHVHQWVRLGGVGGFFAYPLGKFENAVQLRDYSPFAKL